MFVQCFNFLGFVSNVGKIIAIILKTYIETVLRADWSAKGSGIHAYLVT